jgi:hypothetical protein
VIKTLRAENIDKNRPVAEKKIKVLVKCTKCGIPTEMKFKLIGNEYERVVALVWTNCSTKMRGTKNSTVCGARLEKSINEVMPKGK